jgi:hypothetical protein
MSFIRTSEVHVEAPAERVYPLLADVTQHHTWADQGLTVTHVSGPEHGPGAVYSTAVVGALPGAAGKKPLGGELTVVDLDAGSRVVYECKDDGGRYRWTAVLTPKGTGTQVTHTVERLEAPFYIPLIQPLLWRTLGRKQVQHGLDNLKRVAESG